MARLQSAQVPLPASVTTSASDVPSTTAAPRHSALVRVTHWITALSPSCPARQRRRDCDLSPALLLGRNRQCTDHALFQNPHPLLARHGSHRLRLRPARPERLEPLSPLSSRLDRRPHRPGLLNLRPVHRPLPQKPASRARRSNLARSLRVHREPSALRAARAKPKPASYNVLQRLAYLFVIFVLFPLIIWTGLALSPCLRFRVSGYRQLRSAAGNPRAPFTSSSPGLSCFSSSSTSP